MSEAPSEDVKVVKHHVFCIPEVVDAAVAHKQAMQRLTDFRTAGEMTIVHAHRKPKSGSLCSLACTLYHNNKHTGAPESHSIGEMCPEPENEEDN